MKKRKNRIPKNELERMGISRSQLNSLWLIAKLTKLDIEDLWKAYKLVEERTKDLPYKGMEKTGKKRRWISIPHPILMKVQKSINRCILSEIVKVPPNIFGFSGGKGGTITAIKLHLNGLKEDQLPIPESCSFSEYVAV